jgi:hypothetical protein
MKRLGPGPGRRGASTSFRILTLAVFAALAPLISQKAIGQPEGRMVEVIKGVSVYIAEPWAVLSGRFRNAVEIVTPAVTPAHPVSDARILVTTEKRKDHQEALRRLVEIVEGYRTQPTFVEIGGWPALQRRVLAPLPRRGAPATRGATEPDVFAWNLTTAVAADNLVVRLEATVALAAGMGLIKQTESIGRSATFARRGTPTQIQQGITSLHLAWAAFQDSQLVKHPPKSSGSTRPSIGKSEGVRPAQAHDPPLGPGSEIEVATSANGQNVVVVTNAPETATAAGGAYFSTNSGNTFSPLVPLSAPGFGDPSITSGKSGNFYFSTVGFPTGPPAPGGPAGCALSVFLSTNSGATFGFLSNAAFCPLGGGPGGLCFPDQPHIAADAVNASAGGDQVYAVWRNFVPHGTIFGIGAPSTCLAVVGPETPSLTCSSNSGATWTAPTALGSGDKPRIAVGPDGLLYVVVRDGRNVMLSKFSSCGSGLTVLPGFPVRVSSIDDPVCPVVGLDRCTESDLASAAPAVDDTNPAHVYVAYATHAPRPGDGSFVGGNDDIVVLQSFDGGATFPVGGIANSPTPATRFMPGVCASSGAAFLTWYDRRSSTPGTNDLTDFFLGAVSAESPNSFFEHALNDPPSDPQCATGWPAGESDKAEATMCSTQPQIAGHCYSWLGNDLNAATLGPTCDIRSSSPCGGTTHCDIWGGGLPKYGDYNGVACVPNAATVVAAWASNTTPGGTGGGVLPFPSTFVNVVQFTTTRQMTVNMIVLPADDGGRFDVQIDGNTVGRSLGNQQSTGPVGVNPGTHRITESSANGVVLGDYVTSFSGACDSSGNVNVPTVPGPNLTCFVINSSPLAVCQAACRLTDQQCESQGWELPQQCAYDANVCLQGCPVTPRAWVTVTLAVNPPGDPGTFDILIDGVRYGQGVGNGGSVGPIAISPSDPFDHGPHIVTLEGPVNYTILWGGDCGPSLNTGPFQAAVSYGDGFHGTCAATAVANSANTTLTVTSRSLFPAVGNITITPPGNSCPPDVLPKICTATYTWGAVVRLTASTGPDSLFGWSGDCSGSGTCVLTMDRSHSVTGVFSGPPP